MDVNLGQMGNCLKNSKIWSFNSANRETRTDAQVKSETALSWTLTCDQHWIELKGYLSIQKLIKEGENTFELVKVIVKQ